MLPASPQAPAWHVLLGGLAVDNPGPNDAYGVALHLDGINADFDPLLRHVRLHPGLDGRLDMHDLSPARWSVRRHHGLGDRQATGDSHHRRIARAWNDQNSSNDSQRADIEILPSVDLFALVALTSTTRIIDAGRNERKVSWDFINTGVSPATDVVVTVRMSADLEPVFVLRAGRSMGVPRSRLERIVELYGRHRAAQM